ncbi:MAG: hypothetical protein ACPLZF_02240 [Nitrososphaeria archaeon]
MINLKNKKPLSSKNQIKIKNLILLARVAAGIGFIGAGTIIAEQGRVVGITTASSL